MEDLKIDFRFIEIENQLLILEDIIESIQLQTESISYNEKIRLQNHFKQDLQDRYIRNDILNYIEERINISIPQLFYNSLLVAIWSQFESSILFIANYIKK